MDVVIPARLGQFPVAANPHPMLLLFGGVDALGAKLALETASMLFRSPSFYSSFILFHVSSRDFLPFHIILISFHFVSFHVISMSFPVISCPSISFQILNSLIHHLFVNSCFHRTIQQLKLHYALCFSTCGVIGLPNALKFWLSPLSKARQCSVFGSGLASGWRCCRRWRCSRNWLSDWHDQAAGLQANKNHGFCSLRLQITGSGRIATLQHSIRLTKTGWGGRGYLMPRPRVAGTPRALLVAIERHICMVCIHVRKFYIEIE